MKKTELKPTFEIDFNQLTLGDALGDGGFGVVYKATYLKVDAAVKKLKTNTLTSQVKEEFQQEMTIMSQLHHPHIVQLYGMCLQPYAIVMEYMPKGSLFHIIHSKEETLDWPQRYRIGIEIGKGIYFLHSQHIIHRDLKSLNVLLDNQYHAKLCDFGLAKVKSESSSTSTLKKTGHTPGTTRWKAAELFKRGNTASTASDIYAYGMVLWEMAARQIPYQEERDDQTVISWIISGELEKIPTETPKPYAKSIQAAWQLEPGKRPDAGALIEQLETGQQDYAPSHPNVLAPPIQPPLKPTKEEVLDSGPRYFSMLPSQPALSTLDTQYVAPLSSTLPTTQFEDTPGELVKAAQAMLRGRDWQSEQKAYFQGLVETLSLPPLQTFRGHTGNVIALVRLPNGQVASSSADHTLKIWDVQTQQCLRTLTGHTSWVTALVALSSKVLASGSNDKTIKLWDIETGQCLQTLTGHTNNVTTLVLLPSGVLASGSVDHTLKLWDVNTGQCLKTLTGHDSYVTTAVSLPSDILASGSNDHTLKLWDVNTGQCLKTLPGHTDWVITLVLLPSGILASGSADHTLKLWDINTGQCLKTLTGRHAIISLRLLGDTHLLSSSGRDIQCWRLDNWQCEQNYTGLTGVSNDLVALSDTDCLAASGHDLQRISFAPLAQLRQGLSQPVQPLTASGRYAFFKARAPQVLKYFPKTLTGHTAAMNMLAALPLGMLASSSTNKIIKLWDTKTGQCLQTLAEHTGFVTALAVLSSGVLASSASDNTIKLWDTQTGQCLKTLTGHTGPVTMLTVLLSGMFASSSADRTIKLWDMKTGQHLQTLTGHTSSVCALVALPSGALASSSHDSTIKLWDTQTGQCLQTLIGHTNSVRTLMALPSGALVSGSDDKTIKVWDPSLQLTFDELEKKTPECKMM